MARSACASSGHSAPSRPASMPWPTKTSAASVAPSSRPSSLESGNPPPPEDFRGRHARAAPVNPLSPAELVIDHSVQVDEYGTPKARAANTAMEFARNRERYAFLRWGQTAFRNFSVVPPNTGIVHQVNLEYLGRVIFDAE